MLDFNSDGVVNLLADLNTIASTCPAHPIRDPPPF